VAADGELIGRDGELARLHRLVDPPPEESRVLILLGDAGMGKTVLLADTARQAGLAGLRALHVTGRESEQDLAFAGLHQLLRPVLDRVAELPDRQAAALLGAFGLATDSVPPDALLTGIAVLTMLGKLSEDGPLLVTADELALAIAADPAAGRRWAAEPLPPTDRLAAVITARFRALPGSTRRALLLAAVADSPDLIAAAIPGLTADALARAEEAGLVRVDESGPQFAHPLVRAAVYHAVPFAERAAAHRRIAATVRDQPDRYAWHLAAAALEPDERVASLLEETAAQAQRRGGAAAAARALERAAGLSPDERGRARRLLAAATMALAAGQADWVLELANQALTMTADPELRIDARRLAGWALIWSNRCAEALATLIMVVDEAATLLPAVAWDAIGLAGTAAYHCGAPADYQAVLTALDLLQERARPPEGVTEDDTLQNRAWILAVTDPFGARGEVIPELRRLADEGYEPSAVGPTAWLLDDTDLAIKMLREAFSRPGVRGSNAPTLSVLQWAYIDSGRWDEALVASRETADAAAAYKMETVALSADLATATVLAMRGDRDRARTHLDRALGSLDTAENRAAAARAWHAAGIAALAEGSYLTAYGQLSQLFGADGAPLHSHASYLGIADLAAAAVRAERQLEARTLMDRVLARVNAAPGPRFEQLSARAAGLLAEPTEAEAHFAKALSEPEGDQWPFERAQLRLDYGEWLRRQRRINDARAILGAALDTFRRLAAAPWTRRAEAELRACGVTSAAPPRAADALAELTAQQREVVLLAGRGLTNAEIADRLFLSTHTVASHLYRSYPKLGIAGRRQLHDLIAQADQADGAKSGE